MALQVMNTPQHISQWITPIRIDTTPAAYFSCCAQQRNAICHWSNISPRSRANFNFSPSTLPSPKTNTSTSPSTTTATDKRRSTCLDILDELDQDQDEPLYSPPASKICIPTKTIASFLVSTSFPNPVMVQNVPSPPILNIPATQYISTTPRGAVRCARVSVRATQHGGLTSSVPIPIQSNVNMMGAPIPVPVKQTQTNVITGRGRHTVRRSYARGMCPPHPSVMVSSVSSNVSSTSVLPAPAHSNMSVPYNGYNTQVTYTVPRHFFPSVPSSAPANQAYNYGYQPSMNSVQQVNPQMYSQLPKMY